MIYYDIFLTFGQEVRVIWLRPKYNLMTLLWTVVRHSVAPKPERLILSGRRSSEPISSPTRIHRHRRLYAPSSQAAHYPPAHENCLLVTRHYIAFHQRWDPAVCERYVLYPEALKIVATAAIGVIFILRVTAIYHKDLYITIFVWVLLVVQLVIKIVGYTHCL